MIRRIATVIPTTIPVLAPVERSEFVGDNRPSNASVLGVSVTESGVGLVVIMLLVDGKHGASEGHSVCEDVSFGALLAVLVILESYSWLVSKETDMLAYFWRLSMFSGGIVILPTPLVQQSPWAPTIQYNLLSASFGLQGVNPVNGEVVMVICRCVSKMSEVEFGLSTSSTHSDGRRDW
jgi:hypothetical protein